jgi:hypothetical protein
MSAAVFSPLYSEIFNFMMDKVYREIEERVATWLNTLVPPPRGVLPNDETHGPGLTCLRFPDLFRESTLRRRLRQRVNSGA